MGNPTTDELLKLARYEVLDHRNGSRHGVQELLGSLADEIERLQKILRDWGICGWERSRDDVSGCTRSHPHEEMNAECERLTEVARSCAKRER